MRDRAAPDHQRSALSPKHPGASFHSPGHLLRVGLKDCIRISGTLPISRLEAADALHSSMMPP